MEEEVKAVDVKDIAAEEMGKKLLESMIGVVQSIKRPWDEMTQSEQDDAIGKMRFAVKVATTQAVRLIGSMVRLMSWVLLIRSRSRME